MPLVSAMQKEMAPLEQIIKGHDIIYAAWLEKKPLSASFIEYRRKNNIHTHHSYQVLKVTVELEDDRTTKDISKAVISTGAKAAQEFYSARARFEKQNHQETSLKWIQ